MQGRLTTIVMEKEQQNYIFSIVFLAGFLTDQQDFQAMLERTNQTIENVLNVPGTIDTHAGGSNFRLNNMSFAGPVVMGIGGKNIL